MPRQSHDVALVGNGKGGPPVVVQAKEEEEEEDSDDFMVEQIASAIWNQKYQLINMTLYLLYMFLVSAQAVYILQPDDSAMAAAAMDRTFKQASTSTSGITVADIGSEADVWEWLVEVLVPATFVEDRYSARYSTVQALPASDKYFIMNRFRLLGAVLIQQKRFGFVSDEAEALEVCPTDDPYLSPFNNRCYNTDPKSNDETSLWLAANRSAFMAKNLPLFWYKAPNRLAFDTKYPPTVHVDKHSDACSTTLFDSTGPGGQSLANYIIMHEEEGPPPPPLSQGPPPPPSNQTAPPTVGKTPGEWQAEDVVCFQSAEGAAAEVNYDAPPAAKGPPSLLDATTTRKCCFVGPRALAYDPELRAFPIILTGDNTQQQHLHYINGLFSDGMWLDSGTRGVEMQIPMYSRQMSMFTMLTIDMTVDSGGNWNTAVNVMSFKTHTTPENESDRTLTALRICQLIYVAAAVVKTVAFEMRWKYNMLKRRKFSKCSLAQTLLYTHKFALVHLLLSLIWMVQFMIYQDACIGFVSNIKYAVHGDYNENTPAFFSSLKMLFEQHERYALFTVLFLGFTYLRFLQFTDFHPKMALLSRVIMKSMTSLMFFMFMVMILTGGFAILGWIMFPFPMFSSFAASFQSCGMMALGMFGDYETMEQLKPTLAPVFFWVYTILIFIFVINMLLAIINDVYVQVGEEMEAERAEKERLVPKLEKFLANAKAAKAAAKALRLTPRSPASS